MPISYDEPVYRPPSEAGSLLIQATIGCAHATCSFCVSSVSRRFAIRPLAEIKEDLEAARRTLGPQVPKLFLLAQNAFIMPGDDLIALSTFARKLFPGLRQISLYAHPHDILSKSPAELEAVYRSGITLLYVGLESGHDEVLRRVGKRLSAEKSILACRKALEAGFRLSCTVIVGLGGKELSGQHAAATGRLVSAISPHYLGCLTLLLPPGTELERRYREGSFELLSTAEVLEEFRIMLESMGPLERTCVFRANHASNYLSLAGDLPDDRERLRREILAAQRRPGALRPEMFRAL
jgi:radical SAM superfamily enzyme YgiQ (UPF0313 family)